MEGEDHVEVNGAVFPKPFVEKPVSAEDHNVYIYYPTSAGGGSQRLFRKVRSSSSGVGTSRSVVHTIMASGGSLNEETGKVLCWGNLDLRTCSSTHLMTGSCRRTDLNSSAAFACLDSVWPMSCLRSWRTVPFTHLLFFSRSLPQSIKMIKKQQPLVFLSSNMVVTLQICVTCRYDECSVYP